MSAFLLFMEDKPNKTLKNLIDNNYWLGYILFFRSFCSGRLQPISRINDSG